MHQKKEDSGVNINMKDTFKVNGIIEINHKCREFCKIPYHGHKNGCPNFNINLNCPPKVNIVENLFDMNKDLYFIVEEFDLKNHMENMYIKHPQWTEIQLKNLLYWQGGVRKRLKIKTEKFIAETNKNMIYTLLPEAMGVMVIDTALKLGIPIEKSPKNKIFKIALVGFKSNINNEGNKYENKSWWDYTTFGK